MCNVFGMTTEEKRDGGEANLDLDIEQDDKFQRREWRVEKVGTALLVLFLLAGLLGFLGKGPFSQSTVENDAGTLSIDYQRIAHYKADQSLTFKIAGNAIEGETVTLELTGPWVSGVDIPSISPQPSTQYAVPGGVAMEFDVMRPGDLEINLSPRATEYFLLDANASVGEDSLSFSQFVLP